MAARTTASLVDLEANTTGWPNDCATAPGGRPNAKGRWQLGVGRMVTPNAAGAEKQDAVPRAVHPPRGMQGVVHLHHLQAQLRHRANASSTVGMRVLPHTNVHVSPKATACSDMDAAPLWTDSTWAPRARNFSAVFSPTQRT